MQLKAHPLRGALFETWAIVESIKGRANAGLTSNLYFWRDRAGLEMDCVVDRGSVLMPIEIKSGQTVASDFFSPFSRFAELAGDLAGAGWVVYGGDRIEKRSTATVLPWKAIERSRTSDRSFMLLSIGCAKKKRTRRSAP